MVTSNSGTSALRCCSNCLSRSNRNASILHLQLRSLSISARLAEDVQKTESSPRKLDPKMVFTRVQENKLIRQGLQPVGSRRLRAALNFAAGIPFEQLPYQCFQEARKVLAEDRAEKVKQIETQRSRIARLMEQDPAVSGGEQAKQHRIKSMQTELERLKILADINDPLVKKKFEDGMGTCNPICIQNPANRAGDMNKPVYRFLADRKWREYKRKVVLQRVTQMNVIPDVIPNFEPTASVAVAFDKHKVEPGVFVASATSEQAPTVDIQVFDKGPRLVTIVVVDSDIPNLETDAFDSRCLGIFANIEISPVNGRINLGELAQDQIVVPWFPPTAQKGSPYHRISVTVLQQANGTATNAQELEVASTREPFSLPYIRKKTGMQPVGITLFRTQWDENMAEVMERHNIPGAKVELRRKPAEKLPYKKKDGARYR
jgi:large subunit ribosomal protein L35